MGYFTTKTNTCSSWTPFTPICPLSLVCHPLLWPYPATPNPFSSGAEGTIIEEHDNLPRMIWGLGADDAPVTHSYVGSHIPYVTPHPNLSRLHRKAPPRLQKKQVSPAYLATPKQTPTLSPNSCDRKKVEMHQHALDNLGSRPRDAYASAMVLDNILRLSTVNVTGTWDSLYGKSVYRPQDPVAADGQTFKTNNGIALDWQVALAPQKLKNSLFEDGRGTKPPQLLKPSAPVFLPSHKAPALHYPRIFVEPRSTQSYQEPHQSRRIPAIDIGQQYHQQQINQNVLLTPPSSSSPQWSSNFSPCQGSLNSTHMALPQSNRIPNNIGQHRASSNELLKFVHERIASGCPNKQNYSLSTISPSTQTVTSQLVPTGSADVSHSLPHTQFNGPSSTAVKSHPAPPPSTPLPPLPFHTSIRESKFRLVRSSFLTTTPTRPSPEARPRSVSYQHPRSIPVTRLMQRKLSSVPEEDFSSYVQYNRSPPPRLSIQQTNRSQVHIFPPFHATWQCQKPFPSSATRTPSPVPAVLALRSRTGGEWDSGELSIEPGMKTTAGSAKELGCFPVKVRLPRTPLKAVPVEQPKDKQKDETARRSKESKENVISRPSGLNSRKKGRGKIKDSLNVGPQLHLPLKSEGEVSGTKV